MLPIPMKLILVGDASVGKTTLRKRVVSKDLQYSEQYLATIGADFSLIGYNLRYKDKDYPFKVTIWDIAGQETFSSIRDQYFKGTEAVFVLYDITNKESYSHIQNWMDEIQKVVSLETMPIVLIGNKLDLRDEVSESLSPEDGQNVANSLSEKIFNEKGKVLFIETSAKTGENVDKAFDTITKSFLEFYQKN